MEQRTKLSITNVHAYGPSNTDYFLVPVNLGHLLRGGSQICHDIAARIHFWSGRTRGASIVFHTKKRGQRQ